MTTPTTPPPVQDAAEHEKRACLDDKALGAAAVQRAKEIREQNEGKTCPNCTLKREMIALATIAVETGENPLDVIEMLTDGLRMALMASNRVRREQMAEMLKQAGATVIKFGPETQH